MGEIAEALRRSSDAADSQDRPSRAEGGQEIRSARTTPSLDAVLGRSGSAPNVVAGDLEKVDDRSGAPHKAASIVQPVARSTESSRAERISVLDEATLGAASARRIAQKVKRRAAHREARSIVVTSALRGEGKTTTACNLAIALTRLDRSQSVVLVDLDLRRPSVGHSLGLTPVRTVNEVLDRRAAIDEALIATDIPGLSVLVTDRGTSNPERLLSSHSLRDLFRALEQRFSRVIIDTPPTLLVSDAMSVIDAADAYIFVAKAGSTPTKSVQTALDHLPREKALGCVLNYAKDATSVPTDYYAYTTEFDKSDVERSNDARTEEIR